MSPEPDAPVSSGDPALALAGDDRHPLVEAFLADQVPEPERVVRAVHSADAMLGYLAWLQGGDLDAGLWSYFRTGLSAFRSFEPVLAWRFGDLRRAGSILDFASGHGRATRFLVGAAPPERVWVSEIKADAVDFQRRRFGVHGFVSATDPAELDPGRRFDAILVASLFTHLPRGTFAPWLETLLGLLEPGGVLAFTVHDEAVMLPGRRLEDDGFYFEAMSEDDELDLGDYGSTWVSEAFVAGELARLAPGWAWKRFPKALWHLQDLYVVARPDPAAATDLEQLRVMREPEGYLDGLSRPGCNRLTVSGWAVVHPQPEDPNPAPAEVEIYLGGRLLARLEADGRRPDVAEHLGGADLRCGFEHTLDLPSGAAPTDLLTIKARSADGREAVLHLSTLQGAYLGTELAGTRLRLETTEQALGHTQRLVDEARAELAGTRGELAGERHRADQAEALIRGMEASRFWKARNAWFALKRRLGLVSSVIPGPKG